MELNEVNIVGNSVQVLFRKSTPYGEYQDALYFPQDDYEKLSPEEIEAMKQFRIDNWIAIITAPLKEEEPIDE